MQWAASQKQGAPPADFVGGFQFPFGAPSVLFNPPRHVYGALGVAGVQSESTPQNDYYQHPYFPEPCFPDEAGQHATSLRITYTRVYGTGHSESLGPSKGQNELRSSLFYPTQMPRTLLPEMPRPQYIGPRPPEQAPPSHYQTPQQYAGPPSFYAPAQPPALEQNPTHGGPRVSHHPERTARKKAVCVGINYTGIYGELEGCVNDAKEVCRFLIRNWGFGPENIIILTDDTRNPKRLPTKANILGAMKWLVRDAKADDSLFFHYSGHGGQIPDKDGDEIDGYDEVIFPLDHEQKGIITDDLMNNLLVRPIPGGCRLTALFDSCHSGSVLDLVYRYRSDGQLSRSEVSKSYRRAKSSAGDVISFSGCSDSQDSVERESGMMSYAFMKCLDENPKESYQQLLKKIRGILRKKRCDQKPQLSSSRRIDTNSPFTL